MTSQTILIGPRSQITLPKKIRNLFGNTVVLELVDNNHVMISPVHDVGGSLSSHAKKTDLSFEAIRNAAWKNYRSDKDSEI